MVVIVAAFIVSRDQRRLGALGITGAVVRVSLRRLPFHRVLYRPILFLGGEREPTLFATFVAVCLASFANLVTIAVAAALWFLAIPALRWMAKHDPQLIAIYRRHRIYAPYYAPRSRPYRDAEKSSLPFYVTAALLGCGLFWWML